MILDGARHFEDFDGLTYLNCANHGALPRVTAAAMREAIGLKERPNRVADDIYFTLTGRARAAVSRLVGARPECVTLGSGESHGMAVAALGFPWEHGDELVIARSDFPANVYIWLNAARAAGVRATVVASRRRAATTEEILAAIGPRTRVVTVSHVDYGSGEVMDLARLAAACRTRGVFLAVDATQSAGAVPLDMSSLGISLLTVAGYKWMLGPYGSGFAAFDPEWMERIRPTYVTWTAAEGAERFNTLPRENWTWAPTARRFDAPEAASFVNVTGLARSAEFLHELGVDAVHAHVAALLDRLEAGLPPPFRRRAGASTIRGPILSVEADDPAPVHAAYGRLRERGIVVSLREDAIRVSPHVYNTGEQVDRLLAVLGESA